MLALGPIRSVRISPLQGNQVKGVLGVGICSRSVEDGD
jgi:hypothetical protein